jgi:hypothetical protein
VSEILRFLPSLFHLDVSCLLINMFVCILSNCSIAASTMAMVSSGGIVAVYVGK